MDYDTTYFAYQYPPNMIPDRFMANYIWGMDTIPEDIKRCCLMIATRDLMHSAGRRATLHGTNLPEISAYNIDEEWINSTLEGYKNRKHSNT